VNVLVLAGASVVTSVIVGVWPMAVAATAAMGHSQNRMQCKVTHWQERAMRAEDPAWRDVVNPSKATTGRW
jgi:hypothetical protein